MDKTISLRTQFERLFKECFDRFFEDLHRYAYTILKDNDRANDAVQSVFTKWWEIQTLLKHQDAAKAYLYTAVYRHCLNMVRHEKVKSTHHEVYASEMVIRPNGEGDASTYEELDQQVGDAIESLPPQCRTIFLKSRWDGKRYNEIADEMNLSVKTIEAQMGKALKILREKLKDYL